MTSITNQSVAAVFKKCDKISNGYYENLSLKASSAGTT